MPLTQIDDSCALIVVDLQKGIVGLGLPGIEDVVSRSATLAGTFRELKQTVVLVNVDRRAPGRVDAGWNRPLPPDFADLIPELQQAKDDVLITKHCVGACLGSELDVELKKRGVTQVFFVGVATGSGVESSARSAFDLGYNVVFVKDAMLDMSAETQVHCLERVFPKLGEVESFENVLAKLGS